MHSEAPSRLRVVFVVAPAPSGGLETVVASLAAGMAERGHMIQVVSLLGLDGTCEPFVGLPDAGVDLREIRFPPRSYREEIAAVRQVLATGGPALVHTHGFHGNLIGWRAARRAGMPVVATVHGYTGGSLKGRAYDWFDRRVLRYADAVVPVSTPLQTLLEGAGVPSRRMTLIRNARPGTQTPLDRAAARAALGLPHDGLIVGWVGRLSYEKGPDQFVDAVARLPEPWRASVVGTGPMVDALVTTAETVAPGRVTWHGAQPSAGLLLRAFDVVALTSRTEGTPMVVLEAMAAGVPVVATRVGGVADLLGEEEGAVVPPGDTEAVARAIDQVRTDRGTVARRATLASRRLDTHFGYATWLDHYERLYRSLTPDR